MQETVEFAAFAVPGSAPMASDLSGFAQPLMWTLAVITPILVLAQHTYSKRSLLVYSDAVNVSTVFSLQQLLPLCQPRRPPLQSQPLPVHPPRQ
jgi:hypothetical protein